MGQTCVKNANMIQVQHWGPLVPKRLCHPDLDDLYKNESVQRYLQQLVKEHRDIRVKLQHAYLSEADRKVLMRKHIELLPVTTAFERSEQAQKDLEEVLSLLHSEDFKVFIVSSNVIYM